MTSGRMMNARREYLYKVLSEAHRKHQADKPGDTDETCGVCKINNGTLYAEKSEGLEEALPGRHFKEVR
jgi:hypothetical protein